MFRNLFTRELKTIAGGETAKTDELQTSEKAFDAVKLSLVNLAEVITKFKVYDAVQWVGFTENWHKNRSGISFTKYNRGDIVYLDLGAQNFGHEPSYSHTCIVLGSTYDMVLIAPCSSKAYGKEKVINATPADGFAKNTGIQAKCCRWVSKNRVISVSGKTNASILKKIDETILNFVPLHYQILDDCKKREKEKNREIFQLKKEKADFRKENIALQKQIKELQKEIVALKSK